MNSKQTKILQQFISQAESGDATRRALAVSLLENHMNVVLTGYSIKHAERLRRDYISKGEIVFKDKRHSNRDRVLTKKERTAVVSQVRSNQPKDLITGCEDDHWNTYWLGEYIRSLTGKKYKSKTSSYLIFKEAKLTWHKPGKVYDKADPIQQELWRKETIPILQAHWNNPNTVILCADEMVLTISSTLQKIWLPQGEYPPVIETTGTRKNKSFYGFLNLKTGQEHTFITDYQNMYLTKEQLIKLRGIYPTKHLVMIWDNAGWHRGSQVTEWMKEDKNTEAIHFPPYSPNLNPQEHVWKAGRKAITHNQHIVDIKETSGQFKKYLESHTFAYELLGLRANQMEQL